MKHRDDCVPEFLPRRGWSKHIKGYLIYTSKRKDAPVKRGQFLHRAIVEKLLGAPIAPGLQVTHLWPFDKTCGRPERLMLAPPEFNPSPSKRCPITGHFLSFDEYSRRYGVDWNAVCHRGGVDEQPPF